MRANNEPKKILVADDDTQVRGLFVRELSAAGYDARPASSGQETLAALRASPWDLLVLDLNMPGTDGFEVLKRARAEFPKVPVLVVSGYMTGPLLKAAEWFGAAGSLDKEAAPERLVATVKGILGDQ